MIMIVVSIITIIVGLVTLIFPKIGWILTSMGNGGMSKRNEIPGYGELVMHRIIGVGLIIFGVIFFYVTRAN